ncbi:flagellar protein FlaI [Halogranum gelatinilyticum]|uniref:Flagellar protein FlaI n=1 Tax=Halogranum gelatinilyticum TaxID=660521 RepID=A0A1G9R4K2_9EURY|nr:type II/IV secretion system ATPase subunit [Halogranum gelatinilyticum]SDM18242.1 flagellar protein FlaI [Halogranum gelatinilyticum]
MATDDAGGPDTGHDEGTADTGQSSGTTGAPEATATAAAVGEYTWRDYLEEYGPEGAAETLYADLGPVPGSDRWDAEDGPQTPTAADWERTAVDPTAHLGFHPDDLPVRLGLGQRNARTLHESFEEFCDPATTPVVKDVWLWEHYKREYYYEDDGSAPTDAEGEKVEFDAADALGFDPSVLDNALARANDRAEELSEVVDERTVDIQDDIDEDAFFSSGDGVTTVANRYDLEKAVPMEKKTHFREIERYWVNEPYAFVVVFQSTKENEKKYYVVEPYLNRIESDLEEFLTGKLRTAIKYADEDLSDGGEDSRRTVIQRETHRLLDRYDLYTRTRDSGFANELADQLDIEVGTDGTVSKFFRMLGYQDPEAEAGNLEGISVRPEPVLLEENADTLSEYQVDKLLYFLTRDFIGYERIDAIKQDINVEDISCDGYNSPVFVYHGEYEQIISNVFHGEQELDEFVVKLAQRSGKGISKRRPQVDATLPDGSRAQLTLGREVSDHGTNYTIRQFKDVPFTPLDLINWKTFSLDEMAFLWLCIENNKSLIFAGGTASGKTTSLNAVSLFIPSNTKIVSIEDTREVELPQRNWIASVTRPSFSDDDKGDVDEFDLLEAALRQRPDYIVMGEIRGEEGRTLFQVMSTGHTTYTTFHADSVGEVLKRFTTDPINVSKTMFTALDLVSIQTSTRVQGRKVRRNKSLTEINHYDAENDEINVQDVYQWQAETDEFLKMGESNTLDEIMFDRGWNRETLQSEIFQRQVVLAYLIVEGLNTYTQVAATFQAFINDPDTILGLMATDKLERSLEDLREMESVLIDIDPDKEEMVPRPDPTDEILAEAKDLLARAEDELFAEYRDADVDATNLADALGDVQPAADVAAEPRDSTDSTDSSEPAGPALGASDDTPTLDAGDETPALDDADGPRALDAGDGPPGLNGGGEQSADDTVAANGSGEHASADGNGTPSEDDGFADFDDVDADSVDDLDETEDEDLLDGVDGFDVDSADDDSDDSDDSDDDESVDDGWTFGVDNGEDG